MYTEKFNTSTSALTTEQADLQLIIYDETLTKLVAKFDDDLTVKKKALDLSILAKKFVSFLPSKDQNYKTVNLQKRLMKHYGDCIEVLSQLGQGQSNIILSSNIKLDYAVKAAKELNRQLKQSQAEMCLSTGDDLNEEHSVLHKAAGIIRAEMAMHVDTTV